MKKKFIAPVLAVTIILSLASCGGVLTNKFKDHVDSTGVDSVVVDTMNVAQPIQDTLK